MVKHPSGPRSSFYWKGSASGYGIHLRQPIGTTALNIFIQFVDDLIISNILFFSTTFSEAFQAVK